jgi:hypothetical protein
MNTNQCPRNRRPTHLETHEGARSVDCAIFDSEPTLAAPFNGDRMARREYQNPKVKLQKGPRPYWYIRYRVWVFVDKNQKHRKEKLQLLGYRDQMTKKEAERIKEETMLGISRHVLAIGSRVSFENRAEKTPFLPAGPAYRFGGLTGEAARCQTRGGREPVAMGRNR